MKHFLTQGDTIVISSLASQEAQGAYALANNYGGLIARLGLQPIEESSRNYFGKVLSSVDKTPSKADVDKASKTLHTLLRAYTLLSVFVLAIGPAAAPLLLSIIAGQRWIDSGAGQVLSTYCYYIPVLAINGVTEAFVSSVATQAEIYRQSMWMLAFSVGFAGASYVFLHTLDMGAQGLVWANSLNMVVRILWSSAFIARYLKRNGSKLEIRSLVPSWTVISTGIGMHAALLRMVTFANVFTDLLQCGTVAVLFLSYL